MNSIKRLCIVAFTLLPTADCFARAYDFYRADYTKGAFCSVIGGACATDPSIEAAFFQNPASIVLGKENLGFDVDYNQSSSLEPGMKGGNSVSELQYLLGIGARVGRFGMGLGASGRTVRVSSQVSITDEQGVARSFPLQTDSNHVEFNLPIAYRFDTFNLGFALVGTYTDFTFGTNGSRLSKTGSGVNFGFSMGMISYYNRKLRFGTWFRSSLTNYNSVSFDQDILSSVLHYQEDLAIHSPWILASGAAYQLSKKTEVSFDLDLVGRTANGLQLTYDTFSTALGDRGVRSKGRALTFEPRLGLKTPWPLIDQTKGTLLLGTYFEPSRWEGLPSRWHQTVGLAYRTFDVVELMAGADIAKDFFQLFLTFR